LGAPGQRDDGGDGGRGGTGLRGNLRGSASVRPDGPAVWGDDEAGRRRTDRADVRRGGAQPAVPGGRGQAVRPPAPGGRGPAGGRKSTARWAPRLEPVLGPKPGSGRDAYNSRSPGSCRGQGAPRPPSTASHSFTVLSHPAVASVRPSGAKTTPPTACLCP